MSLSEALVERMDEAVALTSASEMLMPSAMCAPLRQFVSRWAWLTISSWVCWYVFAALRRNSAVLVHELGHHLEVLAEALDLRA